MTVQIDFHKKNVQLFLWPYIVHNCQTYTQRGAGAPYFILHKTYMHNKKKINLLLWLLAIIKTRVLKLWQILQNKFCIYKYFEGPIWYTNMSRYLIIVFKKTFRITK